MKKAFSVLLAGAGVAAASVYGIYRYVFYSPTGKQNDDHHILAPIRTKAQYDKREDGIS